MNPFPDLAAQRRAETARRSVTRTMANAIRERHRVPRFHGACPRCRRAVSPGCWYHPAATQYVERLVEEGRGESEILLALGLVDR